MSEIRESENIQEIQNILRIHIKCNTRINLLLLLNIIREERECLFALPVPRILINF